MITQNFNSQQIEKLAGIKHLALDMDGTIYSGSTLFDFTIEALEKVESLGVKYTFLTNNSSRSVNDYLKKIHNLGIRADISQVYTSSLAALEYLEHNFGKDKSIFVFGTASLREEFVRAGFRIVTEDDVDIEPDIVVAGFDTELTYKRLCKAAYWVSMGKPYIATHPDRICPTDQPLVLVDCGAVCSCIQEATGRAPDIVLGKPDPCMIKGILDRHLLEANQLAMVGDRLYTDIAMAHRAGAIGVLVLSGETTLDDLKEAERAPDFVMHNLMYLVDAIEYAKKQ